MSEWTFAQHHDSERLCHLQHFSMIHDGVEFMITMREYITPPDPTMRFYATADKQTNQKSAPFTPVGWGNTLLVALSECMKAIRLFPHQPD